MITYTINGKPFEIDETILYYDYYLCEGKRHLELITMVEIVGGLEDGRIPWDTEAVRHFKMWSRWANEAPRKRFYRDLARSGVSVLCAENFFIEDGGDVTINQLENTGKLAVRLLEHYGEKGVGPIKHNDPVAPVAMKEILKG